MFRDVSCPWAVSGYVLVVFLERRLWYGAWSCLVMVCPWSRPFYPPYSVTIHVSTSTSWCQVLTEGLVHVRSQIPYVLWSVFLYHGIHIIYPIKCSLYVHLSLVMCMFNMHM